MYGGLVVVPLSPPLLALLGLPFWAFWDVAMFDYPDEIRGLVRFMPVEPGEPTGPKAIKKKWRTYVQRVAAEYRDRVHE
jgi:hypothetical protein